MITVDRCMTILIILIMARLNTGGSAPVGPVSSLLGATASRASAAVMSSATTVRISWPEIIEEELDESSEVSERAGVGGRDSTVGRACVSRGMPDGEGRSGAVGDEVVAYLNWRWRVIPW